jgi:hypothetical protein
VWLAQLARVFREYATCTTCMDIQKLNGLHFLNGYSEDEWIALRKWVFNSITAHLLLLGIKIFLTRVVLLGHKIPKTNIEINWATSIFRLAR